VEIDGEDHKKWRRLLDPIFGPKQMAPLEAQIRQLAAETHRQVRRARRSGTARRVLRPATVIDVLATCWGTDRRSRFLHRLQERVIHPEGDTVEEMEANMAAAGGKLLEYFVNFLATRRAETEQKNDVIAVLLRSEVDGQPIAELDLLNIMFLLMFAGLDTVTSSLSCIFAWLGQHPEERDRLVADRSLLPAAIEEIMRYESPVPSGQRFATENIDLGDGLVIKAGEAIHAIWAAANVDPTQYDNPLEVDFDRGRTSHIVFASGTHRCLGSHLARMELRIALDEILTRLPDFTVPSADDLVYDNVSVRAVTRLPVTFTPATS
jgi:cytochrome P450